jgi:putative SOS response-associated peptidase YedK
MCFTVEINIPREEIEKRFNARFADNGFFEPGYYFSAFSLPHLPVITNADPEAIQLFQWGLIPFWIKNDNKANDIRFKTMNARAETLNQKPSFKAPFKYKRCLIISHGFYEWHTFNNKKFPFYLKLKNDQPFAFAGIYDSWTNKTNNNQHFTFSLITTSASPLLAKIHNTKKRMPVILEPSVEKKWISDNIPLQDALNLLQPYNDDALVAYPISPLINSRNENKNTPALIKPYEYKNIDISW